MQFFYSGRPTSEVRANPPADLIEKAHGDWVKAWELYGRGVFRQLWMLEDGVIAICEADSREQLEADLSELPLAQAGYITYSITEIAPYRGFAAAPPETAAQL